MRREELVDLVRRHAGDWIRSASSFGRVVTTRDYGGSDRTIHVVDAATLPPEACRRAIAWTTAEGLERLLRSAGLVSDCRGGPAVVVDPLAVVEHRVEWETAGEYEIAELGNLHCRQVILHELGHVLAAEAARETLDPDLTLPLVVSAAATLHGQEVEDRTHCRQWARAYLHASERASRLVWPREWWLASAADDVSRYLDAAPHEIAELASTLTPEVDDDASLVDVLRRDPPPAFDSLFNRLLARRQAARLVASRRTLMVTTLDALRQRSQYRSDQALDTLAQAARDQAAGREIDVQAVDAALYELRLSVDDFGRMVAVASRRRDALADLEKLAVARGKRDKAQAALDAEKAKIEEAISAYHKRAGGLVETIQASQAIVDAADAGRRTLLNVDDVPGTVGRRYREATESLAAVTKRHEEAERSRREADDRVKHHSGWIRELAKVEPEEVDPSSWVAAPGKPAWQADGHAGELDKHYREWRRATRELEEAAAALAAARIELDAAKGGLVAAEAEALKA
jgi:hypothetical protein